MARGLRLTNNLSAELKYEIKGAKSIECLSLSSIELLSVFRTFQIPFPLETTGCLENSTPLLNGNRNDKIRYHHSPSGQLNLSIFNLDPHTLHLKTGHQTLKIQACKVKTCSAPETRGFAKGPSHVLLSQACCTGISTLTFSFLH